MNCVLECMLRATSIDVGNVVVDMNTTSFNLMWSTNMAYNSSYFITLSVNSENVMHISTNEVFVNLILQINLSYCIDIYYEVKETRKRLEFFQTLLHTNNNYLNQGNITGSKKKLRINFISTYNCSSNSINYFGTTLSSRKLTGYSNYYKEIIICFSSDTT